MCYILYDFLHSTESWLLFLIKQANFYFYIQTLVIDNSKQKRA
jgi:hypothetical protein